MRYLAAAFVLVLLAAQPALAAAPGFIVSCNYSHSNNDDPIVYPGTVGAAHLHDFVGAKTTNAVSTPDSLQAGGTTCAMAGDLSGYWFPALYVRGGQRVLPQGTAKHVLLYYRKQGTGTAPLQRIPRGLKVIVGNSHATTPDENEGIRTGKISWKCGPGSGTNLKAPPAQCDSGLMVLSLTFPQCWDGARLDSPNHKDHVSYPVSGKCPASHPVPLPRIESFIRYNVGPQPIGVVELAEEGGERAPHFTAHMDFFSAWKDPHLDWLLSNCWNKGVDCGKNPSVPLP